MNMSQAATPAFFSYARDDSDFALRLVGDLKAAGALRVEAILPQSRNELARRRYIANRIDALACV